MLAKSVCDYRLYVNLKSSQFIYSEDTLYVLISLFVLRLWNFFLQCLVKKYVLIIFSKLLSL